MGRVATTDEKNLWKIYFQQFLFQYYSTSPAIHRIDSYFGVTFFFSPEIQINNVLCLYSKLVLRIKKIGIDVSQFEWGAKYALQCVILIIRNLLDFMDLFFANKKRQTDCVLSRDYMLPCWSFCLSIYMYIKICCNDIMLLTFTIIELSGLNVVLWRLWNCNSSSFAIVYKYFLF